MGNLQRDFISNLEKAGINKNIIDAFERFSQEDFFDPIFKKDFYTDNPIPIGQRQQGGQPLTIARMLDRLSADKKSRVIEIGTGSGYSTALLSSAAGEVVTVEYNEELALSAKKRLVNLGIKNVKFLAGNIFELDNYIKYFDSAVIFAGFHERPLYLFRFVKRGGLLVYPMGPPHQQQITVLRESGKKQGEEEYQTSFHEFCSFTPLIEMYE